MGRPFAQELNAIDETYTISLKEDLAKFERYISNILSEPIIAVGSGGSFAVAVAFSTLIENLGGFAKVITPFELLEEPAIYKCHIVLFTAGGNNPDTIYAYKYIKKLEPLSTYVVCANQESKIEQEMQKSYDENLQTLHIPNGKDGFLAVNSTIGMLAIFVKIYCQFFHHALEIDKTLFANIELEENFLNKKTIIALCGRWTQSVTVDFESKCTEAGLVNIQIANLRNFAHGRHHWIAKNINDTSIICFVTESDFDLAEKTLEYIPNIPKLIVTSSKKGILSLPELFTKMFSIVQKLGTLRGIDPGRPQVPGFGRKIYRINYNLVKKDEKLLLREKNLTYRAINRKCPGLSTFRDISIFNEYFSSYKTFKSSFDAQFFDAIIFDYDNTIISNNNEQSECFHKIMDEINILLEHGITIGFATGRGKSIRKALRKYISSDHWENIWVGFYNCACLKKLSDNKLEQPEDKDVMILRDSLMELVGQNTDIEYRGVQISISTNKNKQKWLSDIVHEIIRNKHLKVLLYESDHSIDVVSKEISKLCLYNVFSQNMHLATLCIGDSGNLSGNDYDLLNTDHSLSADKVSFSFNNCWNLAPLGVLGPAATLYYLKKIDILKSRRGFRLRL